MINIKSGALIKAVKQSGKIGATLKEGQEFIGTLLQDIKVGNQILIDQPGINWLATTLIISVEVHEDFAIVKTRNSIYKLTQFKFPKEFSPAS